MALDIEKPSENNGIQVAERGRNGTLDRRLFMQMLAFGDCGDVAAVQAALDGADFIGTLYTDLNDSNGIGLVAMHEDPDYFVTTFRGMLQQEPFASLTPKPDLTMFGRTYTIGYESPLEKYLIDYPINKITNPDNKWAIWYPLRRDGSFQLLSAQEQRTVLMEHGGIGRAYGEAGHGTDIRLACHGLDRNDNDYVIALLGKALSPLSKIVERMRKTKQTSQHLSSLGPFFVGRSVWQKGSSQ